MDLVALAIAPVAIILFWVYQKDRYETEPMSLIFKLMAFGAVACLPAAILEIFAKPILFHKQDGLISMLIYAVLGIGLVEESCKFIVLRWVTWRNPFFTQRYDGIVYAVSASLGFALLENMLYVSSGGVAVGLLRAVTAVPMHTVYGILMGVQYGRARFSQPPVTGWSVDPYNGMPPSWPADSGMNAPPIGTVDAAYRPYQNMVAGTGSTATALLWKAALVPSVLHGLYDFFAMASIATKWFIFPFALLMIGSISYAFILVTQKARRPY